MATSLSEQCSLPWSEALRWLSLPAHAELLKGSAVFMSVSFSPQTKVVPKKKKICLLHSRRTVSEIASCYIIVWALKTKQTHPIMQTEQAFFPFYKHPGCWHQHLYCLLLQLQTQRAPLPQPQDSRCPFKSRALHMLSSLPFPPLFVWPSLSWPPLEWKLHEG